MEEVKQGEMKMTKLIKNDHNKAKSNLIVPHYLQKTADNNVSAVFDKVEEKIAAATGSDTAEMLVEDISKTAKYSEFNAKSEYRETQEQIINKRVDKYRLSYIEDYEEDEARKQIEELLGFEAPRVCGFHMAVKIYVRPDQIEGGIYIPDMVTANDRFRNCTALVIAKGSECYSSGRFTESLTKKILRVFFSKWMPPVKKPWCKVGDWIVFPRNEGPQINYRGIPMQIIPDDKCYMIIQDPTHVTRD
jgi:hypothetical protein